MRKLIFLFGVLKGHSIWNGPLTYGDDRYDSYDYNDTEDICDNAGREPIYKYGTKVCNKFKFCENGVITIGTCPEGQYFDTVVAACYYASTLPCGVPCAVSCDPITFAPTTAETTERPVVVDDRCNWHPTGVSPRKHLPGTCSGFSYCSHGQFHHGTCPQGQYFDKTIEACYYTDSLPCGVQCAAPCQTTTDSPIDISNVDAQCLSDPTGVSERFALYYKDIVQLCNSFAFCSGGKYYEDECTPGQYFDPSHGGCLLIDDLPCGSPCSNPCKSIDPACVNYPTGVSPRHQVTIDGEVSCNSFGYCKDGDHIIEECTPGQYFDGGPKKCFPIDDIPCGTPCSNPCPPTHPMCVNHPFGVSQRVASLDSNGDSSCTDFGYCLDGDYIIESCTPGQYFDEEIAGCLPIDSLPCGSKCTNPCPVHPMCHHHPKGVSLRFSVINADGNDDCTTFAYCVDGDYVTEECTPGQYFDASIAGCLPLDSAPCSSHCSNLYGLNGYVSCTQFETCIGNEWKVMTCDGDFVYDTTLGICVDPSTIPCGSPCAPDCTTEISEKDIINAIEEQVECEANYVQSQLVSTIENLILTGQQNCGSTNWESFGFTVLPEEYQDHLDQLREEARERFELLINSPLVVADLASALNQLSVEHQSIQANGEEILSELVNFLEASS